MADYALSPGFDGVFHRPTSSWIPNDPRTRAWITYQDWLAVPNVPDADVRTLDEARQGARGLVHDAAELELSKYDPRVVAGAAASSWAAEAIRREAVAADAEGLPWAAGYPFLEEQVGIHGADVGAVATFWLGRWATFENNAKEVERVREQALADIDGAADIPAVDAVVAALTWPNKPLPTPVVLNLVVPVVTVSLQPEIVLTPDPAVVELEAGTTTLLAWTLKPTPAQVALSAPAVTVAIA